MMITSFTLVAFSLLLPVFTAAKCTRFEASGNIERQLNTPERDYHLGQISPTLTCPQGKNANFYSCASSGFQNGDNLGCVINPEALTGGTGGIYGRGSLRAGPEENDHVYALVNAAVDRANSTAHIARQAEGCLLPGNQGSTTYEECVEAGRSAYIDATSLTYCTNGTLSGCDDKGEYSDGPIQVCGPRIFNVVPEHPQNKIIYLRTKLVYVNDTEIEAHKTYNLYNKNSRRRCDELNSSAHTSSTVSWILMGLASALSTSFVLLG